MRRFRVVDGKRTEFTPKRRPRPKLCRVCRAPATWVVERADGIVVVRRTGRVRRSTVADRSYRCDAHSMEVA